MPDPQGSVMGEGADDGERLRALYAERDRVTAELNAVEDGTLPWLEDHFGASPASLAQAFGISVQAANNRLAKLVGAGLATRAPLARAGGGRFFVYTANRARPRAARSSQPTSPGVAHKQKVSEPRPVPRREVER